MADWLYGAWTYRSFYNREEHANTIDDVVLAEAELTFESAASGEVRGQLAFRSGKPDRKDPILVMAGSLEPGAPSTAKFRGTGLPGTGADGWIYDYVGYLVPHWPGGKGQVTAMVGSVTRLVDHPGSGGAVRHAGEVYSFIAVRREFPEARTVIPIADPVLKMLASRHHRLHHLLWHTLRNNWMDEDTIKPAMKRKIEKLGWAPARAVRSPSGDPLFANGSGEDFLFMHRQMVIEVNDGQKKAGADPIRPWSTIPGQEPVVIEPDYLDKSPTFTTPGNPRGFSVPPWYPDDPVLSQRLMALKSTDFYWSRMLWWDRQFKDPAYLATLTLGELGTLLEWSVHNDMHMRWASTPRDFNDPEKKALPNGRPDWDIGSNWDDPLNDHLGDQYSSHVNPVFWRLHGWVDARIGDWFRAHADAHPGEVTDTEVMGTPWFKGKPWVQFDMPWCGPMDMHAMHDMSMFAKKSSKHGQGSNDIKKMEEILQMIFPPPPKNGAKSMMLAHHALGNRHRAKSRF